MRPERWRQIDKLFQAALEHPEDQRPDFVREACGGDDALRKEVESLLGFHERGDRFMEGPGDRAEAIGSAEGPVAASDESKEDEPLIGRVISHYRILDKLGTGGMGVVYRAEDVLLRRHVALKFLRKELDTEEDARSRFQREARAASSLNHPNICTIHDVGEYEGHPYLVMELIEGQTLKERIAEGPVAAEEVAAFGMQLADALESAHAKQIVHRDIKPANVFVTPRGQVKLLDFGLARKLPADALGGGAKSDSPLTKADAVVGTLMYVAPEVLMRKDADARSDLWGLGMVLYELASGTHPFTRQTMFQTTSAILYEPPARLASNVPEGLKHVILRCLAKDPAGRYQRASEARAALETIRELKETVSDPNLRTPENKSIRSIAVLPFHNQSADPEADYLSWGITQSLIYCLGQLEKLHVAPASSVHRYKGQTPDPLRLGQDLRVGAVLTGRVAAHGDELVVGTELVDAQSGWQIWGRQYTRKAADLASIHEEIAREITEGLRLSLTRDEKKLLEKSPATDPLAYQLYLKGRFCFNSKDENGLQQALRNFTLAVRKDPRFAAAQAGVAEAYAWLGFFGVLLPQDCFPKAKEAEGKASQLDPGLSDAHAVGALTDFLYRWDMRGAEQRFRRSIELDSRNVEARFWFAWFLAAAGRPGEAEEQMVEVETIEPGSLLVFTYHAFMLYLARRHDAAIEKLRAVLLKAPRFAVAHWWLGLSLTEKGDYESALEAFSESVEYSGCHPSPLAAMGNLYGRLGWANDAKQMDRRLGELAGKRYVSAFDRAVCVASGRDKEAALGWIERATEERSVLLAFAKVWPALDPMRGEGRFQAVVKRLGFESAE